MTGSSPRLRGTDPHCAPYQFHQRFIPAPAGNSPNRVRLTTSQTVHPRACGEQRSPSAWKFASTGSSPRLRGTVASAGNITYRTRFIPAPAGNSSAIRSILIGLTVHPRACGEQISSRENFVVCIGSSPRLRGTDIKVISEAVSNRFIPAPAGNRSPIPLWRARSTVHPRACGEQKTPRAIGGSAPGSSPRLRGNSDG